MADPASFSFLPWLRRGVAAEATREEGQPPPPGSAAGRVAVEVGITLNAGLTTSVSVALLGPGEVTGVDPLAIIRTYPIPGVFDVESNFFPLIEFDQADFPWRYTPARAGATQRLTPWIALAVLRDDEIESLVEARGGALPILSVADAEVLPPWNQAWAWAHVQVSGSKGLAMPELATVLEKEPHRVISRLLCPRRLEPNTAYTALLVPTFERGRRAGARESVPDDLDAMTPAWADHGPVRLPVYYRWRFGTGPAGDFEFLVRQLEARNLPPTIGLRNMDVSAPGAELPPAFDRVLGMEGALSAIGMTRTEWIGGPRQHFLDELASLLNLPADREVDPNADRAVVPPLYGRWHALARRLVPGAPAVWFNDLNQDPRERVAAGAGTRVIQQQQRQLMASAWLQVKGVREANERLRLTQLARELALRVYTRHLSLADPDQLLQIGSPVLSRIMASPTTIQTRLLASPVLPGMLESQFRRVMRPRGPVGRRQGRPLAPIPWNGFSRINRGDLRRPAPPSTSDSLVTPKSAPPAAPPWATPEEAARLRGRARLLMIAALVLVVIAIVVAAFTFGAGAAAIVGAVAAAGAAVGMAVAARSARTRADRVSEMVAVVSALAAGSPTPEQIMRAPAPPDFEPAETIAVAAPAPRPAAAANGGESPAVRAFRTAARDVAARLVEPFVAAPALRRADLSDLRTKVAVALDPKVTVVAGVRDRLKLPGVVRQPTADVVEPVMAAPQFPNPMYAPLAAVSEEFMLPGLEKVPQNTVALVLTNQRFIEAYMVGLNHEMARELQWNEYPTDMRGTYFRQFWDPAGSEGPPEGLLDILPLHQWTPASDLGRHAVRPPPPGGQHLVLLIRGELFRRYPNTQVYAVKAKSAPGGQHALGDEEMLPIFSGRLPPDVTFFGFTLTPAEARGDEARESPNQGWFFVLQEQPSEPRFGLDIPETVGGQPLKWSDLSWGHLALDDADLARIRYIDLSAALPDTSQVSPTGGARWHVAEGASASDLAFITLQQPMRVAVHGSDMVPPPTPQ